MEVSLMVHMKIRFSSKWYIALECRIVWDVCDINLYDIVMAHQHFNWQIQEAVKTTLLCKKCS